MVDDKNESVTYGHVGYETWEDEAAEREEARQAYRRRLLSAIRGRLEDDRGLRWSVAAILLGCTFVAWLMAIELHATGRAGWTFLPGLGIMFAWPVYVAALLVRAHFDSRLMDAKWNWDALRISAMVAECDDHQVTEKVDETVGKAWSALSRNRNGQGGGEFLSIGLLTVISIGTWLVWDLLMMAPGLIAEYILDGVLVPAQPTLADHMPCYPWYKNLLIGTVMHFLAAAVVATIITSLWNCVPGYQH